MARRVSLQGKGAELFFGGSAPTTADPDSAERTRARVHAPAMDEDELLRGLGEKQRLASSTFRFQPEELDQLDRLFEAANQQKPRRISKNDLVRLGLRWLICDYEVNADHSLVGKLLQRV